MTPAAAPRRNLPAAVAPRVLTLEPATGRIHERRGGLLDRLFGPQKG